MPITLKIVGLPEVGDIHRADSVKPYPLDRLHRIAEVTRFEGSTTQVLCGVGDFSFTIYGVTPDKIDTGYLIMIESYEGIIHTVEWARGQNGYVCNITGKSLNILLERNLMRPNVYDGSPTLRRAYIQYGRTAYYNLLDFCTYASTYGDFSNILKLQSLAIDRLLPADGGNLLVSNRYNTMLDCVQQICAPLGLHFILRIDRSVTGSARFMYFYVRKGANASKRIYSDSRGVSGFSLTRDISGEVNRVGVGGAGEGMDREIFAYIDPSYETTDAYKKSILLSSVFVDARDVQEDATIDGVFYTVEQQLENRAKEAIVKPTVSMEMKYDNTGSVKYGVDFYLSDYVEFVDEYLGVSTTTQLTEVTTNYKAGVAKSYDLTFGAAPVTYNKKMASKYNYLNKATSLII